MKQNQEKNFTHQNLRAKHLFTGDKIFFESHHQAQQWITKTMGGPSNAVRKLSGLSPWTKP